jgi:hypothetical protein
MLIGDDYFDDLLGKPGGRVRGPVGEILPEASAERVPRNRYRARLAINTITTAVVVAVKRRGEEWVVWLPDNEDVSVFVGVIAFSLLEVKFRRKHRVGACSSFRQYGRVCVLTKCNTTSEF